MQSSRSADDRLRIAERSRHAIYGSVIVLAVIIALDETAIKPREAIASVLGAAIATVLAEIYADYLAGTIRAGRAPTKKERNLAFTDAAAGTVAAILPIAFFVLAALGVMEMPAAFDAAVWTGVAVVGFYAFAANRLGGMGITRSVLAGIAFAALGAILVLIKAAVH